MERIYSWMAACMPDNVIRYNKPVVEDFKNRYGIDISKFEDVEPDSDR